MTRTPFAIMIIKFMDWASNIVIHKVEGLCCRNECIIFVLFNFLYIMLYICQFIFQMHDVSRKIWLLFLGPPRDCIVSEWAMWTPCSKTCGLGEMTRSRTVLMHSRRGGRPCPPLKEARWCGSARSCGRNYFNWG